MFSKRKAALLLFAGLAISLACSTAENLVSGIMGTGTTPKMIEGTLSAGWTHTCVLTGAGKVKCWGSNEFGQLGDGSTENRNVPVDVAGLTEGIKSVSAGFQHSCVLTAEGGVKCWGSNYFGQLGNGANEYSPVPVNVEGLGSGVKAVSAGASYTCALLADGSIQCWGANDTGQLGNGTHTNTNIPVTVKDLTEEAAAVATGEAGHSCAILKSGAVACWGNNEKGQLGDSSRKESTRPVPVEGISDAAVVALGYYHTCILKRDGQGWCWGDNAYGQLGDGTTDNPGAPVKIMDLPEDPLTLAAGSAHTCVLSFHGEVFCWGWNEWGQLGSGPAMVRNEISLVPIDGQKVIALSTGGYSTCALMENRAVMCWGGNDFGQLGDGTFENHNDPVSVLNLPGD
ncbi:MAG: hypothetical protein WBM17_01905 [Anaerolineales bacterium]